MSAPTLPPLVDPVERMLHAGPSCPSWSYPETVARIAGVDPFDVDRMARGSETYAREVAERPVDWGWTA